MADCTLLDEEWCALTFVDWLNNVGGTNMVINAILGWH